MRRRTWSALLCGVALVALLLAGCGGDDAASDADDLSGTQWRVATIGSADALADPPATLAMLDDGNIAGTTGCNTYNGVWEGADDDLTLTVAATTEIGCEEALMQQEEAFLQALAATRSFELDDDSLELHDANGETLATLDALE